MILDCSGKLSHRFIGTNEVLEKFEQIAKGAMKRVLCTKRPGLRKTPEGRYLFDYERNEYINNIYNI